MDTTFNSKDLIKQLVKQQQFQSTSDIMNCVKDMFADVLQETLNAEMDNHLGFDKSERREETSNKKNYRNGTTSRTLKTQLGEVQIDVPRDRNGEFESGVISKYQRNADGLEDRILSLYATGMSVTDIKDQIKQLYDVDISPELVSKITDKIMPVVKDWQNRPLESYYPFILMDAIHYKVREDHRIVTKASYVVLAINEDGMKDVLGIWIGASESSKYWAGVLNELKSRGVSKVSLFCVDGLTGFKEAIESVNSGFRKVTKKGTFPNENALFKLLYLRIKELNIKWKKGHVSNWSLVLNQLMINDNFKTRIDKYLNH